MECQKTVTIPATVTIPTSTIERVMTALAQAPLGVVFNAFVELKMAIEESMKEQAAKEGR